MCRGNFRSSWVAEGGYDFVAEALFGGLDGDGFFLEYDDARSGDFSPLRFVPPGKRVVLGLTPPSEGRYCGFSSTVEGNTLRYDEQVAWLALIVQTAAEIWT